MEATMEGMVEGTEDMEVMVTMERERLKLAEDMDMDMVDTALDTAMVDMVDMVDTAMVGMDTMARGQLTPVGVMEVMEATEAMGDMEDTALDLVMGASEDTAMEDMVDIMDK